MAVIKSIIIASICVAFIVADPIPELKVKILEYTIKTAPDNPYFGIFIPEIINNGEALNVKTPIKKDLPADMKIKSEIKIITNGTETVINDDLTFCEHLNKHSSKETEEAMMPKDKYPKKCPITACEECEIVNFRFPISKFPPGSGPTIMEAHFSTYLEDVNAPLLETFAKVESYY